MKKILFYFLLYFATVFTFIFMDKYYGSGPVGMYGKLSWLEIHKNIGSYLFKSAILVIIPYYFFDFRKRKKNKNSEDSI
jgi:hypothetical protein